ncbi:MAG: nicotinamide-nucleotide amidohydrolase family protein [Planctomycetaceae bacterium]
MTVQHDLEELEIEAGRLASVLERRSVRVVFAESCTAGLVSATLAGVPGVSEHHCGSAVVYRLDTKARWLGVPRELLTDPGPVSAEMATAMATGVLERTPEADMSASVTGHLGPNAPAEQDGLAYFAIAIRGPERPSATPQVAVHERRLAPKAGSDDGKSLRLHRQREAAHILLALVRETLEQSS